VEVRPLTAREMKVYLWLLRETMEQAEILAAQLRAIQVIAGMDETGLPVDPHFTLENPPELPLHRSKHEG